MRIGVLGGIGPQATGRFYLKLIERLQQEGVRCNSEFPQIIVNSIPAKELTQMTASSEDLAMYRQGIEELDHIGVDVIVMPCNTVHLFADELLRGIATPLLDLRDLVRERLRRHASVAILGTHLTVASGMYEVPGVHCHALARAELNELQGAIEEFIRTGARDPCVERIARSCVEKGAEVVVLGCTEFAVLLEDTELPVLNTIDVLVDGIVRMRK